MPDKLPRPPAIILGGDDNALSIARSLGRAGITTYVINEPRALVRNSRFCNWVDVPRTAGPLEADWAAYLLGDESNHLRGSVLLAASDAALELIAEHRPLLVTRFRLDLSNPAAQRCMLNKLCTYEAARQVGVPTPRFWVADSREQIQAIADELVFPLVVKPMLGHRYKRRFNGVAYPCARTFDELLDSFETITQAGIRTFLVEMIPGPDDRLCSYYSYLDESGDNLFDYTKRVIRRLPFNMGQGVYHITDEVAGVRAPSLRLFRHVGLRGIGNAEFKLDARDGQLKLIECNARFTAADCLLTASGLNLSLFVYDRLTGRQPEAPSRFRSGVRLWYPWLDYKAYRQMKKLGMLSFGQWARSVLHWQTFPVFRWYDPVPAIVSLARRIRRRIRRASRRRPRTAEGGRYLPDGSRP